MNIGIVGHEAVKFTPETEAKAREIIRFLLDDPEAVLVSGHCPLGGIDIWAEEEAARLGRKSLIYAPACQQWSSGDQSLPGYKERNLSIAAASQIVHCLVVATLPPSYAGRRFPSCYHCKGRVEPHVKSGGCWTAWRCPEHQWWVL